jgi:hypothetical protein
MSGVCAALIPHTRLPHLGGDVTTRGSEEASSCAMMVSRERGSVAARAARNGC